MNISVTTNFFDLSDTDLKQMSQLGVDYIDFGNGASFPGVKEQGYPDLDALLKQRKRIRSWGLDINRVTLPNISEDFMNEKPGSEIEIEHSVNAVKVFGEAGINIVRQRFAGDVFYGLSTPYQAIQRGGAISRGESLSFTKEQAATPTLEESTKWRKKFNEVYREIVPAAQDYGVKVGMHPSDSPHPDSPFGGLGYHRIIDEYPNKNVGYIYCVGTRAEEGGSPLVIDEINHYGRKGRLFLIHFRNVRGSLATAKAFEESLLDDGDLNMFKILMELKKVGYEGCLNPDHVPIMAGDAPDTDAKWSHSNVGWSSSSIGFAYSIGYIKAMLTALNEFWG
ncbi:mannonate dehydratase [Domibacillus sp. DTU_2020_1001157_1_SI_ALB_TIR_016]|uniref:mannonate dehydratase n=1 Tax=Domibacillus sp. DTU_2020_1001157_1_SI_ALB_TIR_016 TaxID=3077789 RepID=UPI0028E5644C|nr:mannonate dehydratase [Domibacillus sp. DTU_2020_1001157_1_SI_ALB_TIR_016]WNS78393.1 mannonate dehydratase [Domibacillus sp. DTU_2020_1001157_1_SI_ALB_TIR_016]